MRRAVGVGLEAGKGKGRDLPPAAQGGDATQSALRQTPGPQTVR